MEIELLYWHWIVIGIALVLSEIFLGSFFIFWFGAAAIVVSIVLLVIPSLGVATQILLWTVLSAMLALGWFKYLKPLSRDRTSAGLSHEAIMGEIGQVLSPPNGEKRGMLRFPAPVLGSDEWLIMSQDALAIGDRVSVVDVSGNSLIVKKA
jgi:membrane protein implicated in regulation of membrane protease activity